VLRAAQVRYPGDVWINLALGNLLRGLSCRDEAIRFYSAARAIRPETAHLLAHTLEERGQSDEAIAVFKHLRQLRPTNAEYLSCLGELLKDKGLMREADEALGAAIAAGREQTRLGPDDVSAHHTLGRSLQFHGNYDEAIAAYRKEISLKPDRSLAHFELGNALRGRGNLEEAIAEYRKAISLDPGEPLAYNNLGHALHDQGNLAEAVAAYRQAISLKPDDATSHSNLGSALLDQENLVEAIAECRKAISLKPDDLWARIHLGNALCVQGSLDEAIATHRKAISLKPGFAEAHTHLGNALLAQGNLAEAIAEHQKAINLEPDLALAHANLGKALRDQGKVEDAVAEYRSAIRLKPDNAGFRVNLGATLCDVKRDYDAAVVEFHEAIKLKYDNATAHYNLGNALFAQRKHGEAVAAYLAAIRLKPDYANAYGNLGNALRAQGKLKEGIAAYREAIRFQPDHANAHNNLGNALHDQGNLVEAIAEYRKAISLNPDDAHSHYNLGIALLAQGNLADAIAEYRKAINLKPDDYLAHSNLGNALRDQGNLVEAIAEYRKAISLEPDKALAHNNLGNALRDQGNLVEAIAEYRKAISLEPGDAMCHTNLGTALVQQGNLAEAIAEYRKAISHKPNYANAHNGCAWVLVLSPKRARGDYDEGLVHARKAVELAPNAGANFSTLALAEYRSGHWAESLAASERSMELRKGGDAYDWFSLALARWQKGDKGESRIWFDKAVAWTKEKDPKNAELRQFWAEAAALLGQQGPNLSGTGSPAAVATERREAVRLEPDSNKARNKEVSTTQTPDEATILSKRWPAVLKGDDRPRDSAERLAFAQMAYDRQYFATATRYWAEAFAADPKFGADRKAQHFFHASHAAILAAEGKGKDQPPPDDQAKVRLRAQALDWLKADLAAWSQVLASGSAQGRRGLGRALLQWKTETDFAVVRDPDALKKLPGEEQKPWRALWAGVDTLLKPEDPWGHTDLGEALNAEGKRQEAAAEFNKAVRLAPYDGVTCFNMALALRDQGRTDLAVELLSRAAGWDAEHENPGLAIWALAETLRSVGRYDEAAATYRRIRGLRPAGSPDVRRAEAEITATEAQRFLGNRLSEVVKGRQPTDSHEALMLAHLASSRFLYGAAARLWTLALADDPKTGDDRWAQLRYDTARAAALAGCGRSKDDPAPDDAAKAKLRSQALEWLRAAVVSWSQALEKKAGPERRLVVRLLEYCKGDPDFAGVRDADALAELPEDERKAWQALWADVDAVLKTAHGK
jgi:tetratricopeptide (TPR) repeat protein